MDNPILKNIIGEKPLSERELEIGNLLAVGLSDNEVASKLSITPDTVKFHLKNIYKKMGINGHSSGTNFFKPLYSSMYIFFL